jgi:hypothetical protein
MPDSGGILLTRGTRPGRARWSLSDPANPESHRDGRLLWGQQDDLDGR